MPKANPATVFRMPVAPKRPQAAPAQVRNAADEVGLRILECAPGIVVDDLRYSDYWQLLKDRFSFRPFDRVEARAHDRTWRVEMTVIAVLPRGLEMHFDKISHFKIGGEPDDTDGTYTVRHVGGAQPFAIFRDKDGRQMPGQFATRAAAIHERALLHPKKVS